MPWEQDLKNKLKAAARKDAKAAKRTAEANVLMDEARAIMDEQSLDIYVYEYGTITREVQPKKTGNQHDRATFEAEFPEIDAAPFGIICCKDPYECKMKTAAEVEAMIDALEGYSAAQKDRMRVLFDVRTMPDRVVVQLRTPGDPPSGWPDDE